MKAVVTEIFPMHPMANDQVHFQVTGAKNKEHAMEYVDKAVRGLEEAYLDSEPYGDGFKVKAVGEIPDIRIFFVGHIF